MQNINVNIVPDSYPQTIRYSQGDVGREFKINVVGFTIPTGATVKIQATKPSGFGFSVAGTVANNAVSFTTTAIMTDEAGRFPAELEITKDSVVIGTANFIMWGEANPHPEGTTDGQQGTIIPELTLLVERVEAAASSVLDMEVVATTLPAGSQATYSYDEDLNKATFGIPQGEAGAGAAGVVADAYSSSKTYKVGDYVLHNSNLYRCTTAITTAEAFTAAHWTQIVLANDVSDLKTDFKDLNDNYFLKPFVSYGTSYAYDKYIKELYIPISMHDLPNLSLQYYGNKAYIVNIDSPHELGSTLSTITENNVVYPVVVYANPSADYPNGTILGYVIFKDVDGFKANALSSGVSASYTPNITENAYRLGLNPTICEYLNPITNIGDGAITHNNFADGAITDKAFPITMSGGHSFDLNDYIQELYIPPEMNSNGIYIGAYNGEVYGLCKPANELAKSSGVLENGVVYPLKVYYNASESIPNNTIVAYVVFKDADSFKALPYLVESGYPSNITQIARDITANPIIYSYLHNIKTFQIADGAITEEKLASNIDVSMPDDLYAVNGDTLQLFKRGMINAFNSEMHNVDVVCDVGQNYKRMYMFTPNSEHVGKNYPMHVKLCNELGEVKKSKALTLHVVNKANSPLNNINVLCVGDSLTADGSWVKEVNRRLTQTGGTPNGDGLSNITFIGKRSTAYNTGYEGYGGWTFASYNTNNGTSTSEIWVVTDGNHGKTESDDQHSTYVDANGATWKLETVDGANLKMIRISGDTPMPSSGTLTWVSGGIHTNNITFSSTIPTSTNPFWDEDTNKVNFANYASELGVTSIDYCYVLLGWNGPYAETDVKQQVNTFITNLHTSFPNCKIVLMGLEVPDYDGYGNNYGASDVDKNTNYIVGLKHVFNLNKWYKEIADSTSNVYFCNIACQFDTEYNMSHSTRPVNTRNSETEVYGTNGVHPALSGYMQIADAVYRDITAKL